MMDASALKNDLLEELGDALDNAELLNDCADMCNTYQLDASTFRAEWEAYSMSKSKDYSIKDIDLDGARGLRVQLAAELAAAAARVNAVRARRPPPAGRAAPVAGPSRQQAADVKPFYTAVPNIPNAPLVTERRYRYAYEKTLERSEELDDRIDRFAELVSEHYKIAEFGDPSAVTEEEVIVVGRICCDADAKLNEASMLLEASRVVASGVRVPLKFAHDVTMRGGLVPGQTGAGFFPGAMAAFKGRNGGGGWFVVSEILPPPPLERGLPLGEGVNVSICVAAGPYSYDHDLTFAPLKRLFERVREEKPTSLFLLGPFVDNNHPMIRDGDVDEHPHEIFRREVLARCAELGSGTMVHIVPSVRDAVAEHSVFPQGDLRDVWGGLPPNVRMLPNPCVVSIGGLRIGASSADVLKALSSEHFVKALGTGGAAVDTYANLCRYVLGQRSFYPLFPAGGVSVDVSHGGFLEIEAPAPDVLILPSAFNAFHKEVDGCAVVNPSFCAKPAAMGSYATVTCTKGVLTVTTSKLA
ncbi:DNA polymerase alpha, subunit B [Exidia glandulosa HHB12029]|uniref:DNA polymerase alpha subunit B n=1 Tax=Exidia glandulosa HHB12029 TaxID=1314781 RepID=A0A166BIS3_EXIGL|nr:DNA polymerase alpha, subunit B [Exidia glandulosa HHB12029]